MWIQMKLSCLLPDLNCGLFALLAACISKYSAGSVQYYPSFHAVRNPAMSDKFESDLRRYITRKIGFESVMRIRCTRGISSSSLGVICDRDLTPLLRWTAKQQ